MSAIARDTVKGRRAAVTDASPPAHGAALRAIMITHTAIWFSIEACMMYVLYAGFAGRSVRRAGIAAGVVAAESLIFIGSRCSCPLTSVAEGLGIERGRVTDLYLPGWFARNLPAIHVPSSAWPDSCTQETCGPSAEAPGTDTKNPLRRKRQEQPGRGPSPDQRPPRTPSGPRRAAARPPGTTPAAQGS